MKAKNLYCLMALCASAAALTPSVSAQDVVIEDESVAVTTYTCDNTDRYYQSWRNNWFIQAGAGINQPFVERGMNGAVAPGHAVHRENMTVTYNFGVGHWVSPYVAFRLNALGGALHWNNPTAVGQNGWSKAKHVNLNAEVMWDMCNSIAGVNPNRVVSVVPFAGIGGDYIWGLSNDPGTNLVQGASGRLRNSNWTLPVTAGVQFRFRLCKVVDFFAEARASFYGDNWNGCAYGRPIEANVAAVGGFNFNINGREWNSYNECRSMGQLAALNNEVNTLRAENLAQAQAIAALESAPKEVKEVIQKDCPEIPLLASVRFTINSDKIMPTEEVNIYNMAQWMKANPNEKVVICGYADKDTGTAQYNMELSKKRADKVYKELTEKYNIPASRLDVKYDGSSVQPYQTNDWNRIVIFTTK